jgi:hypothetical protein
MSFTLSAVTHGVDHKPPRVLLYGPPGIGKTTWAATLPHPIMLRTEDGMGTLSIPTFPKIASTYSDVMEAFATLIQEDHEYQTLILDSITSLEPIIWRQVSQRLGVASIEAPGFGKGYVEADAEWATILDGCDALRDRGMTVVLIAHNVVAKFSDPTGDDYDRHEVALHKRAKGMVTKWSDITAFAHWKVLTRTVESGFNKKVTKGIATDTRLLGLVERPGYDAKNRYALPSVLPLDATEFLAALAGAYAPAAPLSQE